MARVMDNRPADGKTNFSTSYIREQPLQVSSAPVGEIPPAFADLNQSIRDLFTKNYHIGFAKVDIKTVTANGVQIRGIGQQDIGSEAPRAFGSLEHKYVQRSYGLTLIERWSTDNMVTMEASVEDKFLAGAKATFLAGLSAQTGKRNAALKFAYKRPFIHLTTDVDLDFAGPVVRSSAVSSYNGVRIGGNVVVDTAKSAITRYNLALGMGGPRYTLHAGTTHFRDFEMGVYNRVDPNLEVGFQSNFSTTGGNTLLALGAKYDIDPTASVKAKLDTVGQLGVSYTQELRKGVKLTLSTLINGANLSGGGHRYGFGLEVDV
ncbi:voltage-dependent anion-selective channel protein 2-like [Paramacrobiotus metropolitanus]|uniref:voltage-dependent anion-selective channel protein 2-like n=1 Tax=Paramacrobiotus metropolitanus TaxID=2943436 RepID=UPI0024463441|nr:voltage-dependent anion-selective channel protein 2-like [Paramacrobiotus metropolitanus]XP_055327774.1 voltage-dependent anion-selective channel protein 2-like [Paramacrobiotus metropolitanus]XP_055327775.1 voltage-dependent anion-selective channel protein 2-like [Paramacrobiotus metropolitanus]